MQMFHITYLSIAILVVPFQKINYYMTMKVTFVYFTGKKVVMMSPINQYFLIMFFYIGSMLTF